uniref:RNase H type-1 domain-containing protein n=1 Tax=Quercus lobata TaxID=97700 RepID=A0A7N2MBI7_QUELO
MCERIRGDKWLPDLQASRVISPQKNFPNNTRVCALIDEESGRWLEDRVREEFLPHEAEAIISIHLSTTGTEDKLIWSATSNGCYSTKSAYHLLSNEGELSEPGPSNPTAHKQFCRQLWSLNVPNKIRHFLWRASNDSLPTKKNLQKRNIMSESTCERCGDDTEDTIHGIWGCPLDLAPMHEADFHPTHWLSPPLSFYKINYDGVTFQDSALAGLGVVVRYSNGWVIAALSERITLPPTVEVLEALACRKAVSFVIDLDIHDVVFEGDSEVIFKHLSSDQPSMAAFGHIVDDARSLAARLRSFHFSNTKRKGNMVADKLAQLAKVLYEPKIWLEPRGHP